MNWESGQATVRQQKLKIATRQHVLLPPDPETQATKEKQATKIEAKKRDDPVKSRKTYTKISVGNDPESPHDRN
jgi:hypothetical protein